MAQDNLTDRELAALRELTKDVDKQKISSDVMCDILIEKGMIELGAGTFVLTARGKRYLEAHQK